jgi:glycosyltransferase involved in cell wall biosynthesis
VVSLFETLPPDRVRWLGELGPDEVARALAESDIYVWPGIGEAYGLAYLEAAAHGVPVVALRTAGVPAVVEDQRTGLLADATGDATGSFASALCALMQDAQLQSRLSSAAVRFVRDERSLSMAAGVLGSVLADLERG